MRIRVHVQGWVGDRHIERGEEPGALLNAVLEVDGVVIEECHRVELDLRGGDIATVKAHLTPGMFEVVTHDDTSWPELLAELKQARERRTGTGSLIAVPD